MGKYNIEDILYYVSWGAFICLVISRAMELLVKYGRL